eukprot:SAG11_NODE_8673_length_988_cov_4.088864_1_plen_173_part_10
MLLTPAPQPAPAAVEDDRVSTEAGLSTTAASRSTSIYVSNIGWNTTVAALSEHFSSSFGEVRSVTLKTNKQRRAPSYAFIEFSAADAAARAVGSAVEVDGRALNVEKRQPKPPSANEKLQDPKRPKSKPQPKQGAPSSGDTPTTVTAAVTAATAEPPLAAAAAAAAPAMAAVG